MQKETVELVKKKQGALQRLKDNNKEEDGDYDIWA